MIIKELAISYLRMYASKNLVAIEPMFDNNIILRDWKIRVIGKDRALEETHKNFDAVDTLDIEVLHIYSNNDTVAAELKIVIDKIEELYVVDVITFNEEGKITSIRAYKGRGDKEE